MSETKNYSDSHSEDNILAEIGNNMDEEDNDSDWEECEQNEAALTLCLFCEQLFRSSDETFEHCKLTHEFDIASIKTRFQLDCFSYIRLVNFLRSKKLTSAGLLDSAEVRAILANDSYMKPVIINDELLMFDIESLEGTIEENILDVNSADDAKLESSNYQQLLQKYHHVELKLRETEEQLQVAEMHIDKMRGVVRQCLNSEASMSCCPHVCSTSSGTDGFDDDADGYFGTYAHFGIHHEMLQDRIRTMSYRDAILCNAELFQGKTVLDIGCGTGILSMFAAKGGASTVVGVDHSEIVYQAMDIIRANDLDNVVKLVKGRMEDVTLPVEKVDIIVSEWMGYFLLFESMLNTVIHARDKYLKADGLLLPNRCTINIAGISDIDNFDKVISFWDNVYGFKMSLLKNDVVREASIDTVAKDKLITTSYCIHDLNLLNCTSADTQFVSSFKLTSLKAGPLTAIVGWFDSFFDLSHKVAFSTSPDAPVTHWKQTVFYLREPYYLKEGSVIDGKISCTRLLKDPRALKVRLHFDDQHYTYILQ